MFQSCSLLKNTIQFSKDIFSKSLDVGLMYSILNQAKMSLTVNGIKTTKNVLGRIFHF